MKADGLSSKDVEKARGLFDPRRNGRARYFSKCFRLVAAFEGPALSDAWRLHGDRLRSQL